MLDKIAPYWKAIIAFLTPGVTALLVAVSETSPGGSTITTTEWIGIAAACILTGSGVYAAGNADRKPTPDPETVSPMEG